MILTSADEEPRMTRVARITDHFRTADSDPERHRRGECRFKPRELFIRGISEIRGFNCVWWLQIRRRGLSPSRPRSEVPMIGELRSTRATFARDHHRRSRMSRIAARVMYVAMPRGSDC